MPYSDYVASAVVLLAACLPLVVVGFGITARAYSRAGRLHPFQLAGLEAVLVILVLLIISVTVVQSGTADGRAVDLDPLTGVSGTDAFKWLFLTNFVILPMPLAVVAVMRFESLIRLRVVVPVSTGVFLLIEAAQYMRGNRVASSQDVLLAVAGASLAATFVGRLLLPWSREMRRLRGTAPVWQRTPRVSGRRAVLTAIAVLGPLAWVATLPPAPPSAEAALMPGQASRCGMPPGDWVIPDSPPASAWVRWHGQLLPRSPTLFGPGEINEAGGRCFARSPSGALLAAAWAVAADGSTGGGTVAGFQISRADPGNAELSLVRRDGEEYVDLPVVARWQDGDWRVSVGAAMRLSTPPDGYVPWPH